MIGLQTCADKALHCLDRIIDLAARIHSTGITSEQDKMLPGLSDTAEWSLWVFPENSKFEADELKAVADSFQGLRGIIWHASGVAYGKLKGLAKDHRKAFGNWPKLANNLVARVTSEYLTTPNKVYTGVAWIGAEDYPDVATLLSRGRGVDSAVSFIPDKNESADDWTNITYGLAWLWHCHNWIASEPEPKLKADAVVLSYVGLTIKIGGVPALLAESLDASEGDPKMGLGFYGSKELLEACAERLATKSERIGEKAFNRWLARWPMFAVSI